ncbi:MAG: tRNA (adenosine(37)-N6)-dimethylallyltransferase MiaA [Deltaproteobacteria bacterium]|nr:tRNA (adenosine(37)-N6)-dimethylallyltransferase MiaA [Deltaproteobacteria bacterium]
MKQKILAIVGPTAVGKSEVAILLAEEIGAEIVSLDSRLVYRHLDIGTAKPSREIRGKIPHHLIDVAEPDQTFSAADYVRAAKAVIAEIQRQGKRVLLVGGTGWYLKALMQGLDPFPPADPQVRQKLQERLEGEGLESLYQELKQRDPATAARIHPHDRYRIIRGLEICEITGESPSILLARDVPQGRSFAEFTLERSEGLRMTTGGVVIACLYCEKERLRKQIEERTEAMLKEGLIEEVRGLLERGLAPTCTALRSVGYQEAAAHLQGRVSWEELGPSIVLSTLQLAKRQWVWWRGVSRLNWVYASLMQENTLRRLTQNVFAQICRES